MSSTIFEDRILILFSIFLFSIICYLMIDKIKLIEGNTVNSETYSYGISDSCDDSETATQDVNQDTYSYGNPTTSTTSTTTTTSTTVNSDIDPVDRGSLINLIVKVHQQHPISDFNLVTLYQNDLVNDLKFKIYQKIYETTEIEVPIEEMVIKFKGEYKYGDLITNSDSETVSDSEGVSKILSSGLDEKILTNGLSTLNEVGLINHSVLYLSFSQDNGPLNDKPCPEGCSSTGLNYTDENCYDYIYNYDDRQFKLCKPKCVGTKNVKKTCINSQHCNKCAPYRVYSLTDGRYHTRDSWSTETEMGLTYSGKMLYDYIKNKWYQPCNKGEPTKDDLENPFETEFQDVATPENAANRDLKSAYADNNEIKAYQAEWDLNIL